MTDRLARLDQVERRLVAAGFPALTPWWREQLGRWYAHPTARVFVGQVGRGGVKSTTAVRVALLETLVGDWPVPLGECHYFAFVSATKPEAAQRLRQLRAMLESLGVPHSPSGDEVVVPSLRRGCRVFAATVGAVSGFRCFGFCADELAKWTNADSSANPAAEVIASLRAMTITHRDAREFMISSPLARSDFHFEIMSEGDTAHQVTATAPTWVANPSISEEDTRRREPDPRTWAREYLAEPQASIAGAFSTDLDACVAVGVTERPARDWVEYGLAYDAGTRKSATAVGAYHVELRERASGEGVERVLVLDALRILTPATDRPVAFDEIVRVIRDVARAYRVRRATGDIHLFDALKSALLPTIGLRQADMSVGAQARRSAALLGFVRTGTLDLIEHEELTRQMREAVLRERAAHFIITGPDRGTARDDALDVLLLACEGAATLTPTGGDVRRSWGDDGQERWSRRAGAVWLPCEPPPGTDAFFELVDRAEREGFATAATEDWLAEPQNRVALGEWRARSRAAAGVAAAVGAR